MSANRAVPYSSENHARQALIETCLQFARLGLNQGKSGNASLRWHRSAEEGMLVTPSGLAYEHMQIDDPVWVALEQSAPDAVSEAAAVTDPVSAREAAPHDREPPLAPPSRFDGRRVPSSEWRMHLDIYRARREADAVVHVHSSYATTLACLPAIQAAGIPAFHYMIAVAGGHDIRCARYATFGTQALSDAALDALVDRRACLLANHGQIALGADLPQALSIALEVETLSRQYLQALQVGSPVVLSDEEMRRVLTAFAHYGR
ncbi:MAG: class II aldolase [Betaproteobacteria bacterium]|nr:class II aldolase [Betaproteobacteria bacterium]